MKPQQVILLRKKKSPFKRKQKQARNVGMQLGRQMRSIATRQTCFPTTSIPMLNASFYYPV
jgi:hypothetical protein